LVTQWRFNFNLVLHLELRELFVEGFVDELVLLLVNAHDIGLLAGIVEPRLVCDTGAARSGYVRREGIPFNY